MEKLHTIEEVADILGVIPITVYRNIRLGKLRAVKAGRGVRVRDSDLERYLTPYETVPEKLAARKSSVDPEDPYGDEDFDEDEESIESILADIQPRKSLRDRLNG